MISTICGSSFKRLGIWNWFVLLLYAFNCKYLISKSFFLNKEDFWWLKITPWCHEPTTLLSREWFDMEFFFYFFFFFTLSKMEYLKSRFILIMLYILFFSSFKPDQATKQSNITRDIIMIWLFITLLLKPLTLEFLLLQQHTTYLFSL